MKIYEIENTIEPNQEALNYQHVRLQQLQQDPRVLSFLSRNQLDIDMLPMYFPFFDRWLLFMDNDPLVQDLQIEGYQYQLFYHDDFYFQYVKTKEQRQKEEACKYRQNIIIDYLPSSMRNISLASIRTDASMDESYLIALMQLNRFVAQPTSSGFYLYGGVGSGKTYLLAALTNDLAKANHRVGFINMVRFLQDLRNSFSEDDRFARLMTQVKSVKFLVIDDLGAEVVSDWSLRILIEILDDRMNNNLSTHFTTNFSVDQLFNYYVKSQNTVDEINAKRIMDRISYLSIPHMINRKSQRILNRE